MGFVEQKVEYPGDVATLKFNPAKTSVDDIIKAIKKQVTKRLPFQKNKAKSGLHSKIFSFIKTSLWIVVTLISKRNLT